MYINPRILKKCIFVKGAENCKWCQLITVSSAKDCWDYSGWGNNAELIYESFNVGDHVSDIQNFWLPIVSLM